MTRQTFKQRLFAKIKLPDGPDGCWVWGAARTADGYGVIRRTDGESRLAHRAVFELYFGPIPSGRHLDHLCYTPSCVNPAHLRIATPKQNQENRSALQRNNRSGAQGVHWSSTEGRWVARVKHEGRMHSAGRHKTLEAAESAARALRLSLFTHNEKDRAHV